MESSTKKLLYMPEGVRYAKNLLIAIPDDKRAEISQLRKDGDEEGADALRDEELARIRARADEAYARATAPGADYDKVLAEYTDDPGMKAEPARTEGYMVYKGKYGWDEAFIEAALALEKVGDISRPVASDFGYYIIQYCRDEPSREVPLEEVRDFVRGKVIDENRTNTYNKQLNDWRAEAEVVEYQDRLT